MRALARGCATATDALQSSAISEASQVRVREVRRTETTHYQTVRGGLQSSTTHKRFDRLRERSVRSPPDSTPVHPAEGIGPAMQPLTERQEAILEFIRRSIRERGYPPTLREIGTEMNIRSTNGVSDHLRALERKGYLRREDMKSRALRPTTPDAEGSDDEATIDIHADAEPANTNMVNVPLVGRVAAGPLTFASQNVEQQFMMDPSLLRGASGGGETFALRVRGDSMIEAGIHDGDILFVRRQETANRAEIVVALVGDEATVKRYFPERDHVKLQPENKRLAPIYVRRSELGGFRILGVVVGLFRSVSNPRPA